MEKAGAQVSGWPHTAELFVRGFEIVDMETVPTSSEAVEFACLAGPLPPDMVNDLSFAIEAPKLKIAWPPIEGHELKNGDRVRFRGSDYQVRMILADILRESDPHFTGVLCAGKEF